MANAEYFAALDLIDEGALETGWRIKQGDYGKSVIRIQILQNGEIVYDADNPPSIAFKRPDGKSVVGTMTASTGSNTYIYTIEGSELQIAGMVVMDVKYQGTSSRESTLSCRFMVVPDTISSDATPASVYVAGVTLEQIEEEVQLSKSWAVGGTGVREGEDINNSKYYSEASSTSATNAKTSEDKAKEYMEEAKQTDVGTLTTEVSALKDEFTHYEQNGYLSKNILNPTLQTTTSNGVTCTYNGDGTYTVNGTPTATAVFNVVPNAYYQGTYKLIGCPVINNLNVYLQAYGDTSNFGDYGNGNVFTLTDSTQLKIRIVIKEEVNNVVFKPMLTTDTSATYSDFIQYVPSNSTLNEALTDLQTDVSSIIGNVVLNGRAYSSVSDYFTANYSSIFTSKCPITTFVMTLSSGDVITGIGGIKDANNNTTVSGIYTNNLKLFSFRLLNGTYSEWEFARATS